MSFSRIRSAFFFGILLLLSLAALYLIRPFIFPVFWAAVIAMVFYPVYKWINKHLKMENMSAVITLILVVVTVFLPLTVVSILVVQQSTDLYYTISSGNYFGNVEEVAQQIEQSRFSPIIQTIKSEWESYAATGAQALGRVVFDNLRSVTENSIRFVFLSFIMMYTLYFFLKDGVNILKKLMELSPLGGKYELMMYERFKSTTSATLKSTLIIGGIQGLIGGALFAITGVQGAFVWAIIMTVLSIIPAIGSFLVWIPAGLIMLFSGGVWQGVTILLVGAILISNIDNVLRPPLVGKDIQMHPLLVLFSTLGGLALFGVSGFVIGPIIMSLFLAILSIYNHYYKRELQRN